MVLEVAVVLIWRLWIVACILVLRLIIVAWWIGDREALQLIGEEPWVFRTHLEWLPGTSIVLEGLL